MDRHIIPALFLISCLLCLPAYAITAVIGEEVYISGSKPPRSDIYLMVAGLNMPSCGAQMDSIHTAVQNGVAGSFTMAQESSDTGWFYRWDTSRLAGISPGTYRVYAVTQPADACNLAGQEYSLTTVTLTVPSLYVETPVETMVPVETTPQPLITKATTVQTATAPATTPSETESSPIHSVWLVPAILAAAVLVSGRCRPEKKR